MWKHPGRVAESGLWKCVPSIESILGFINFRLFGPSVLTFDMGINCLLPSHYTAVTIADVVNILRIDQPYAHSVCFM